MNHVLVVDDDSRLRRLFREILEGEGYRVSEAANGLAALEQTKTLQVDLIILDLMMPVMDGLEFLRTWTSVDSQPKSRVLVSSASPILAEEAQRIGADASITKPFDLVTLLSAVSALIERGPSDRFSSSEPPCGLVA